eukprot:jgi/Astpho2/7181/Aster-01500
MACLSFKPRAANQLGRTGIVIKATVATGDAELQQVLTAAPGLLYCGMGAFLNYVSAEAVATADLRQSSLALLLGHAHTKESLRRQGYLESRST